MSAAESLLVVSFILIVRLEHTILHQTPFNRLDNGVNHNILIRFANTLGQGYFAMG
jgi:hypothetical protein